jgi:hypothetical protein
MYSIFVHFNLENYVASKILRVSSVFDGDPIMPSLTFLHIRGKSGTNFTAPETDSVTVMGVGGSPNDLATAFLEFVSLDCARYTPEEQSALSQLIVGIHQRHYSTLNQK